MTPKARRTCLLVGLVGALIATGLALRLLDRFDGDPTIFASFGEESAEITAYAETLLGRDVVVRDSLGHDGRFFFVLANDPLLVDPDDNAALLDRPSYRAQRMLYPFLAGGGGLFSPDSVTWALVVVNLLAMGVGTWAVASLASDMGGSPWWGLAFALNLGFISEMNIDAAGVVAGAAAFLAVLMFRRGQSPAGIALLSAAALSREAMLMAAAGTAFWLWRRGERRTAGAALVIPGFFVVAWGMYVRLRLGFAPGAAEVEEIGWPFVGLVEAFQDWLGDPVDLIAGVAIVLVLALFTRRALLSKELVGWAFLGFVALAMLFTRQVWLSYFDISRAIAPALTAFVILVFVADRGETQVESSQFEARA